MPSQADVKYQRDMLVIHRRNLANYLNQLASLEPSQITTGHDNSILNERSNIARIKNILRGWGIDEYDHPDDIAPVHVAQAKDVNVRISADKVMLVIPITEFARMLQVNPELLQYVVYKS